MKQNNMLTAKYGQEVWAMKPDALEQFFHMLAGFEDREIVAFISEAPPTEGPSGLNVVEGVAHINVTGPILKERDPFLDYFGIEHAATMDIERELLGAARDPNVNSIMLDIESPGGTVSGLAEVVDAMEMAKQTKPVNAHATDLIASAAYWIGSHANSLSANKMAAVGSIGVYSVDYDFSAMFDQMGIKTHVVSSHELKGAGVMGSKITEAQLEDEQRLINDYTDRFVSTVAEGRNMAESSVEQVATGQVWLAPEAMSKGLIDNVTSELGAHQSAAGIDMVATTQPKKVPLGTKGNVLMGMFGKAPQVAEPGESVEAKLARLEAENAQLSADAELKEATLAATIASRKESIVASHQKAGRVTPSMMASVERMADNSDPETLDKLLAGFPVQVQPNVESLVPSPALPGASGLPHGVSASDMEAADYFKIQPVWMKAAEKVKAVDCAGDFILYDGRTVTPDELKGEL